MNTLTLQDFKKSNEKLELFEYTLFKLLEWFKGSKGKEITVQDFNKKYKDNFVTIKIMKLHFFVCAMSVEEKPCLEKTFTGDLLDVFDNFHAMRYGHVELDMYNVITEMKRFNVSFSGSTMTINESLYPTWESLQNSFNERDIKREGYSNYYERVDRAIKRLKVANRRLVKYNKNQLIDISHSWKSWQITYEIAQIRKKDSEKIRTSLIREEKRYFNYIE
jgi:uncharacterized phage-associated protein